MPFQDIEEVATPDRPRTPSRIERALRKIFIEDWSLKLLALAITLALWLAVTGQNQPVTIHANVQLNFIRPASLEISNDPPRSIDVLLKGSRHKLDRLSLLDLVTTVDISDQQAGERVLRLSDRAQMDLPDGVKIDSFRPSAIPIRLEPLLVRQVAIEPRFEGKPADGYEVYGFRPNKSTVTLHGPVSNVNALQKAPTETIWIAGRKESFTAQNIAIDISDPKVDVEDPVVSVDVEIGERRTEKSFIGVSVSAPQGLAVEPRTATVTILGPAILVAGIPPEDIKIILDTKGEMLEPRLDLPTEFQGKIVLKSVTPAQFSRVKKPGR
jgi:YbbR domain-containing protein